MILPPIQLKLDRVIVWYSSSEPSPLSLPNTSSSSTQKRLSKRRSVVCTRWTIVLFEVLVLGFLSGIGIGIVSSILKVLGIGIVNSLLKVLGIVLGQ